MQKNTLQPLALIAIVVLTLFLTPSVAQMRFAASTTSIAGVGSLSRALPRGERPLQPPFARVLLGPRRHQVRNRVVVSPPVPADEKPRLVLNPRKAKSKLEKLIDQSGVRSGQRPIVEKVLRLFSPSCLEKLQTFAILYDHPKHRGLAGRGVILVSGLVPDQELIGLLLHEGLGHFREITCLTGSPGSGISAFKDGEDVIFNDDPSVAFYKISWENEKKRKADAARADFVTGYAYQSDNFEDLAESATYFMTQEVAFRARAKDNSVLAQKLAWLETYMPKQAAVAEGNAWDGQIAWDATKLGFTWRN